MANARTGSEASKGFYFSFAGHHSKCTHNAIERVCAPFGRRRRFLGEAGEKLGPATQRKEENSHKAKFARRTVARDDKVDAPQWSDAIQVSAFFSVLRSQRRICSARNFFPAQITIRPLPFAFCPPQCVMSSHLIVCLMTHSRLTTSRRAKLMAKSIFAAKRNDEFPGVAAVLAKN